MKNILTNGISLEEPSHQQRLRHQLPNLKRNFQEIKSILENDKAGNLFFYACQLFYDIVSWIPMPIIRLHTDIKFYRARANEVKKGKTELFQYIHQLSYNKDLTKISQGRFNLKHESLFYASLPTDGNKDSIPPYFVACFETKKELTDKENPINLIDFTVTEWKIIEPFYVLCLCIDERHLKGNPSLENSMSETLKYFKTSCDEEVAAFFIDFLSFFSELSSKRDLGSECYNCLCAFFTALRRYYSSRENTIIDGLIYPSAMSEAKGLNIVMSPYSVDSKLLPEKIQMLRFAYSNVIKFNYLISPCSEALDVDGDTFILKDC